MLNDEYMLPLYDVIAGMLGVEPKEVQGQQNVSCAYYRQQLLLKVLGRLELQGLPDWWNYDYIMTTLLIYGRIGIFKHPEHGVLALRCGTAGQNVFYAPTEMIIENPVVTNVRRKLLNNLPYSDKYSKSEYGVLVKLTWNRRGISEMLDRYAYLLSQCDASMAVNLMNTKTTLIYGAASKKEAAEYKAINDQINLGRPAVYVNDSLIKQNGKNLFITNPAKQNYISDQIMALKRSIINEFLTEIGINNANTDKKERLNGKEVDANNEEIETNVEHWLKTVNKGLELANRFFSMNMRFKLTDVAEVPKETGEGEENV